MNENRIKVEYSRFLTENRGEGFNCFVEDFRFNTF